MMLSHPMNCLQKESYELILNRIISVHGNFVNIIIWINMHPRVIFFLAGKSPHLS